MDFSRIAGQPGPAVTHLQTVNLKIVKNMVTLKSDMNFHICSQKNQQKLLPPELHCLTPVCTKSFVGWRFAPDPTGGAYSTPATL